MRIPSLTIMLLLMRQQTPFLELLPAVVRKSAMKGASGTMRRASTSCERKYDRTALVVGLGNPGNEHARTRHNAGFQCVDALDAALSDAVGCSAGDFQKAGGGADALVRTFELPQEAATGGRGEELRRAFGSELLGVRHVTLVKPQGFMNRSGPVVVALMKRLRVAAEDLLVVFDDAGLATGLCHLSTTKLCPQHNGLTSVIDSMTKSQAHRFARLRVGVGRPPPSASLAAHVLRPLPPDEQPAFLRARQASVRMIGYWLRFPTQLAANKYAQDIRREQTQRSRQGSSHQRQPPATENTTTSIQDSTP